MITIKDKKYYTIKDLSNELGMSYSSVFNWVKSEKPDMIKILRKNYFTEETFKQILNNII